MLKGFYGLSPLQDKHHYPIAQKEASLLQGSQGRGMRMFVRRALMARTRPHIETDPSGPNHCLRLISRTFPKTPSPGFGIEKSRAGFFEKRRAESDKPLHFRTPPNGRQGSKGLEWKCPLSRQTGTHVGKVENPLCNSYLCNIREGIAFVPVRIFFMHKPPPSGLRRIRTTGQLLSLSNQLGLILFCKVLKNFTEQIPSLRID